MADLTEADLDYLRNINTRPGPGVGQSIDPTRPGPTADRIAELKAERAKITAPFTSYTSDSDLYRLRDIDAELSRLRNEQPPGWDSIVHELGECPTISVRDFAKAVLHGDDEHKAWLLEAAENFIAGKPLPSPRGKGTQQSDAQPGPQDVKIDVRVQINNIVGTAINAALSDYDPRPISAGQYSGCIQSVTDALLAAFPVLAQSDAQPMLGALDHIARLTKQRDALIHVLQRCRMVLNNMAMENEGALFNRWPIHHEPLRSDAKHLLPLIDGTLDAIPEPDTTPPSLPRSRAADRSAT